MRTSLCVQKPHSKLPPCGCYVVNPDLVKRYPGPISIPLRHIDYSISILNSLAKISLTQFYFNPLDQPLQVKYSFPIDPKACLYSFTAKFDDTLLIGRVKQKEQARQQYKEALAQGQQVAYGEIDDSSKDIINIKIGNLSKKAVVEIRIEYLQELEVEMNVFWKLQVYSTITPRYVNDSEGRMEVEVGNKVVGTVQPDYTWTFKVSLNTSRAITFYNSPSHPLDHLSMTLDRKQALFALSQTSVPNKDFLFLFSLESHQEPMSILGRTDTSTSLMLSFIPKFHQISTGDAYEMSRLKKQPEYDMESARAEYVFLLDRSGSMSGMRINKAKEALGLFLKSLPQDCYFQVYSFGSCYQKLFLKSQKYSDHTLKQAISQATSFEADLGGTQIEAPLQQILNTPIVKNYPKQIFLLTDGGVSNTDNVIKLVRDNTQFSRVHTVGVGDGASPALIKGCAEKGKGKYVFIQDQENVSGKIIQLLEGVMSPVISNFQFLYDQSVVDTVIPNPKDMPYILKDQCLNIYLIFKQGIDLSNSKKSFKLTYSNSLTKSSFISTTSLDFSNPSNPSSPLIDKMAHYKAVSILCEAIDDKKKLQTDICVSNVSDLKGLAIRESIAHQVLCRLTAFICVSKKLVDGKYQEWKDKEGERVTVVVPQHTSVDYGMQQMQRGPAGYAMRSSGGMFGGMHLKQSMPMAPMCYSLPPPPGASLFGTSSTTNCGAPPSFNIISSSPPPPPTTISSSIGPPTGFYMSQPSSVAPTSCYSPPPPYPAPPPVPYPSPAPISRNPNFPPANNLFMAQIRNASIEQQAMVMDLKDCGDAPMSKSKRMSAPKRQSQQQQQFQPQQQQQQSDPTQRLLSLQKSDGSWNSQQILSLLPINKSQLQAVRSQFPSLDLLLTILVVEYFEKYRNLPEYGLILKKARQWIAKNSGAGDAARIGQAKGIVM